LSPLGKKMSQGLASSLGNEDPQRPATLADLIRVGNLLLEVFSPAVNPDLGQPVCPTLVNSFKYLQSMEKFPEDLHEVPLKRSDATLFFFRLISDLFDLSSIENSSYKYSDLPQYHYMNIPVDTLDFIGLHLAREKTYFGSDDQVSLEWLSKISMNIIRCCERRFKDKLSKFSESAD